MPAVSALHPDDVAAFLARRFQAQHRDWLRGGGIWPLVRSLRAPAESSVQADPAAVRAWISSWRSWKGPGTVTWEERRWPQLGLQELPTRVSIASADEVVAWIRQGADWRRARNRFADAVAEFPAAGEVLSRRYDVLSSYVDDDWQRLMSVVRWFVVNPATSLYPRQLPVRGVHSKWFEEHADLVTALVDAIAPGAAVLLAPPSFIRLRILDPTRRARVAGIRDLAVTAEDLAALPFEGATCLIIENLQTGLAIPDLPGVVCLIGLGYNVELLGQLPWVKGDRAFYWGDVDSHGFAILHRARQRLPGLRSLLMDGATLESCADLIVTERAPFNGDLAALTPSESAALASLRSGRWGTNARLEQERIPWAIALRAIQGVVAAGGGIHRRAEGRGDPSS